MRVRLEVLNRSVYLPDIQIHSTTMLAQTHDVLPIPESEAEMNHLLEDECPSCAGQPTFIILTIARYYNTLTLGECGVKQNHLKN